MELANRIKKEMSEGIVRAILEDAGYRVIDSGIEKVIRDLTCLDLYQYRELGFPEAIRRLPDFTVMDREQKNKKLVEVKYREKLNAAIFLDDRLQRQVVLLNEIYLVCVNGEGPDPRNYKFPERFIRGVKLTSSDSGIMVHLSDGDLLAQNVVDANLWWRMSSLDSLFSRIKEDKTTNPIRDAMEAFTGMLRAA